MEPISLLKDKRILLGITGGISAYKVCTLASHLTQAGAQVDVVMTEAATRFVSPLTFQSLTGRQVYTSLWGALDSTLGEETTLPKHIVHVGLAEAADLLVIAPATANTLAKLAIGAADNLLTTLALSVRCPLLIAPAMDVGMWAHPVTQANAAALKARGIHLAGPEWGRMASGLEGEGRMIEPDELLGHVRLVLGQTGDLAGRRVVVTAGPTREAMDPVRFLSNLSSGRQGFSLAQAALDRGAVVKLVAGPTPLSTPPGAERIAVISAAEMLDATLAACDEADLLLMAAAVADYRPTDVASEKIKKIETDLTLHLTRTPDILAEIATRRAETGFPHIAVGFAAESHELIENARAKLAAKNLDLIVANNINVSDAGFEVETNRVVILDRKGGVEELPLMTKTAVAEIILQRATDLLTEDDTPANT